MWRCNLPTRTTFPLVFIFHPVINHLFQLPLNIFAIKRFFSYDRRSTLMRLLVFTIPSYAIDHLSRSSAFHDQANGVFIPSGGVGSVCWNEKCLSFSDDYISKGAVLDDFEEHLAFDLVEPFLRNGVSFEWCAY